MFASPFVKICTYITIDEHFIIQAFPASKSAHKLLGDIPILHQQRNWAGGSEKVPKCADVI